MSIRKPLNEITSQMLAPYLPSDTSVVDIQVALEALDTEQLYTIEELVVTVNKATEDRVIAAQH